MRRNARLSRSQPRTYWQRMTTSPTGWRGSPLAHLILGIMLCTLSTVGLFTGEIQTSRNGPTDITRYSEEPGTFLFSVILFFVAGLLVIWRGNYLWHRNGK